MLDQQSWIMDVGWNWGMPCVSWLRVKGSWLLCKVSEKMGLMEVAELREFCVCLQYEEAD